MTEAAEQLTPAGGAAPDPGFAPLAAYLKAHSGLMIGPEKIYLMEVRLAPLMKQHGLADLRALAQRLDSPGQDRLGRDVVDAMTTNESLFFRDGRPFTHLRTRALPALAAARPGGERLRLWSAASACGQEAYSLAMVVQELRPLLGSRRVEIIATDLARAPLARARAGVYSQFEVQRGLPVAMLMQHFTKTDGGWQVSAALRDMIEFREWNLLADPRPLGRFDLILCRNVLLYFDADTRARVLDGLARQLAPDGLLYLGATETVLGLGSRFVPVPDERGVFALAPAAG